ncbi:hypothetical protein BD626DRAFT_491504 [Schizophyllum amplum]|uniref:Uncharacterized protein n=1 Tax=Schizophyllum amplum TaxID=97359 RepID=A0A550CHR8_9AGAR|nr:hypothetical protein BD626DRAFT_491504 [Auriculariopsis ampla]
MKEAYDARHTVRRCSPVEGAVVTRPLHRTGGSNHDLLANLHRQLLAAAALRGRGWAARAPWGPGDILTGAPWRRAPPLVPWRLVTSTSWRSDYGAMRHRGLSLAQRAWTMIEKRRPRQVQVGLGPGECCTCALFTETAGEVQIGARIDYPGYSIRTGPNRQLRRSRVL